MKKTTLISFILISLGTKAQLYYGTTTGVSIGTAISYNPYTHVNEKYNYGGFFFAAPVGYNYCGWLIEVTPAYNGLLYSSLCAGLHGSLSEKCSVNFLAGIADNMNFRTRGEFGLTQYFSPSGTFRLCGEHFYLSLCYQDKMIWAGLGVKAFVYE